MKMVMIWGMITILLWIFDTFLILWKNLETWMRWKAMVE